MSNGGLDVGEHASSAPLMRVLYWKFLAASAATGNLLIGNMCFLSENACPLGILSSI
ncbi:hypothetical protein [Nostoc sp.]|uniref:hypothetical protein n=1 Tax=Nostoc sp. TaxID=1180 RepID=UPI002FF9C309